MYQYFITFYGSIRLNFIDIAHLFIHWSVDGHESFIMEVTNNGAINIDGFLDMVLIILSISYLVTFYV